MTLEIIGTPPQVAVPESIIQGQTLEFLMELPKTIPADWFNNGSGVDGVLDPVNGATGQSGVFTTLASQLRRLQHEGGEGLICDLSPVWEPGSHSTKIRFQGGDTTNWPVGPAEFDVVFTRTVCAVGAEDVVKVYRSLPVRIEILGGVTQVYRAES